MRMMGRREDNGTAWGGWDGVGMVVVTNRPKQRGGVGERGGVGGWGGVGMVVATNRVETAERHYLVTYMIFMRKKWLFRKNCINFIAGKVTMRE